MNNRTIPEEILELLGGREFLMAKGVKFFACGRKHLWFMLPHKKRYMKILLEVNGTYTVEFSTLTREFKVLVDGTHEMVRADKLCAMFTEQIGLQA